MGVQGLSTYIEQYSVPYKLQNTLAIVDGGLAINLCLNAKYDSRFGGNYQKIYNETYKIFDHFKRCNVIPIVVEDGRFKDEKAQTMRKRYDDKLKRAISYKDNKFPLNKAASAVSLFHTTAFRNALQDLGVPYCRTEFEADEEMMELARKLNCPVVSCDSDFSLCSGVTFIHWGSIRFKKSRPYLECLKFDREKLLMCKGVSPSVFPFLSVLFSSDYSKENYFGRMFPCVRKDEKFEKAMFWLKGKTVPQVLQELTSRCLPADASQDKIQEFQNGVNVAINCYDKGKTTVIPVLEKYESIKRYLTNVRFNVERNDVVEKYHVPSDIISKVKECRLTSTVLDFFVSDEFECKTMICEDVDQQSAHAPSIRLIEGFYGLLTPYLPEKPGMRLIIRNFRELTTLELKPLAIRNQDPFKILFEIMEINYDLMEEIEVFDGRWLIFILTLIYWRNHCDGVERSHVYSVILTAFALHITPIREQDRYFRFPLNYIRDLNKGDCGRFANKRNSWGIPKKNKIMLADISHIHLYLSFQACLHRSTPLFQLLDLPNDFRVSNFICGDFYHHFYNKIKIAGVGYLDEFFQGFEKLGELYNLLVSNRAVADLL